MIAPDDPRHGTTRGFHAGCGADCCRIARNRAAKRGRIERQLGQYRRVSALGTQRKLRALARMGWSGREVCRRAGYQSRAFHGHVMKCQWLHRDTAEKFAAIYAELSMTPGPCTFARNDAIRKGWAPPLAWDDDKIDDPDAVPDYGQPVNRQGGRLVHAEDVAFLLAVGEHPDAIAERLHVGDREAIMNALRRGGHTDLLRQMARAVAA